jgi:hypothetical protein
MKKAIQQQRVLVLKDQQDRQRTVEPYAIFEGKTGLLLHCYQLSGYSSSQPGTGWRNLRIDDIKSFQVTKFTFKQRQEYRPPKGQIK